MLIKKYLSMIYTGLLIIMKNNVDAVFGSRFLKISFSKNTKWDS